MTSFQDDVFVDVEATINSEWVRNSGKDITQILEEVEKFGVSEILFRRGKHVIVGSLDQLTRVRERLTSAAGKGRRPGGREDYVDRQGWRNFDDDHRAKHGDDFLARQKPKLSQREEVLDKIRRTRIKNGWGYENDGGFDDDLDRGRADHEKNACELMVDNDIWEYIEEKEAEQLNDIKKLFAAYVNKTMDDSGVLRIIISPKNAAGTMVAEEVKAVKLMHESLVGLYQQTFNSCVVETHEVHFSEEEAELVIDFITRKFPTVLAKRCVYNDNFLFIGRRHDAREARQQFQVLARRVKTGELRGLHAARSGSGNDVDYRYEELAARLPSHYRHDNFHKYQRRNDIYENDFDKDTFRNERSEAERQVGSSSEDEIRVDKNYEGVDDEAKNIKQDENSEDEEERERNNEGTDDEEMEGEKQEEKNEMKQDEVKVKEEKRYNLDLKLEEEEEDEKLNSVDEFVDENKPSSLVYRREASVPDDRREEEPNEGNSKEDPVKLCHEAGTIKTEEELDVAFVRVKQEKLDSVAKVEKFTGAALEIEWEDDKEVDLKTDAACDIGEIEKENAAFVSSDDVKKCQDEPSLEERENRQSSKHRSRSRGGASGGSRIARINANSISYPSLGATDAADDDDEEEEGATKNDKKLFCNSEKMTKSKRFRGKSGNDGPKVTIIKKKYPVSSNTSKESLDEKKDDVVCEKKNKNAAVATDEAIGKVELLEFSNKSDSAAASSSRRGKPRNCDDTEDDEIRQMFKSQRTTRERMPFDSPSSSSEEDESTWNGKGKAAAAAIKERLEPRHRLDISSADDDDDDDESEMMDERLIEKLLSRDDEASRRKLKELLDRSSVIHDPKKKINNDRHDDDDDDDKVDDDSLLQENESKQPPDGTIVCIIDKAFHLAGHNKSGTIEIKFEFKSGTQEGRPYEALTLQAYLPASGDGRESLRLMKSAFNDRKLFTVQRNRGGGDVIVPNGFSFKENPEAFPDPDYLPRLMEQLKVLTDEM